MHRPADVKRPAHKTAPVGAQTLIGRLLSFAAAGGSGFVVDIGVLWLCMNVAGLGPYSARAIAIAAAMVTTYVINRTFTFGASQSPVHVEGAKYGAVALLGAGLNYAIYSALVYLFPHMQIALAGVTIAAPFIATFLAVAVVTFFSWFGYSNFVFRK